MCPFLPELRKSNWGGNIQCYNPSSILKQVTFSDDQYSLSFYRFLNAPNIPLFIRGIRLPVRFFHPDFNPTLHIIKKGLQSWKLLAVFVISQFFGLRCKPNLHQTARCVQMGDFRQMLIAASQSNLIQGVH